MTIGHTLGIESDRGVLVTATLRFRRFSRSPPAVGHSTIALFSVEGGTLRHPHSPWDRRRSRSLSPCTRC